MLSDQVRCVLWMRRQDSPVHGPRRVDVILVPL